MVRGVSAPNLGVYLIQQQYKTCRVDKPVNLAVSLIQAQYKTCRGDKGISLCTSNNVPAKVKGDKIMANENVNAAATNVANENVNALEARVNELISLGMPADLARDTAKEEFEAKAKLAEEAEKPKSSGSTDYDDIVDELIRRENVKVYKNVHVINATITEKPNYFMISLTLDRKVRAMRAEGPDGGFVETEHNVIFSSNFALGGVVKHNRKINWLANDLVKNADAFKLIVINSTITIANEAVSAGEEYVNPFSTNGSSTIMQNDTFVNHIIDIQVDDDTADDVRYAKREVLKDLIRGK